MLLQKNLNPLISWLSLSRTFLATAPGDLNTRTPARLVSPLLQQNSGLVTDSNVLFGYIMFRFTQPSKTAGPRTRRVHRYNCKKYRPAGPTARIQGSNKEGLLLMRYSAFFATPSYKRFAVCTILEYHFGLNLQSSDIDLASSGIPRNQWHYLST